MPDAEGVTLEPHSSCVCPTPIKGLGWVGGWVGVTPPPPLGGVGHLSVCGYAKILGGWVPELTPPPPRVAKQNPGRAFSNVARALAWAYQTLTDSSMTWRMNSVPSVWGPEHSMWARCMEGVRNAAAHCSRTAGSHS